MMRGMPDAAAPNASPRPWTALTWLAGAVVFAMAPWFSAAAVLPQLRVVWTLSETDAAWLTLAVQLGFVLGAVLSAVLNLPDRVSPRHLILIGALLAAGANLGMLLAHGPAQAIFLRALTGAALALVYPPALKAMATWFRTGRGVALGIMVGALTLAAALPHLVNGLGGANWQAVIAVTSLLAALGGLMAMQVRNGPHQYPPAVLRPAQAWRILTGRAMGLTTLGYLGHMWELYAMWAWFAVFFTRLLSERNLPDPGQGAAYATFAVVGVGAIGCYVGGVLGDRWGRTRLTALAMFLSGGCALTLALAVLMNGSPAVVLVLSLLWGFWIIADSAQFSTIVSEIADPAYVGTALTMQLALGFTLTAGSIALVPLLVRSSGWALAFMVLAVGPLLGAVAMRRLARLPEAAQIAGGRG
ncbi:major facilitator superfamily MFS_1 [Deinococcus marmoris]|uniref:Major facilitator superfamily MFS_1 n=2 Tax=Deinococcus marmoris TaxID=249408 RepID=A0A1U7NXN9_9DEIO|nr:major facilitator superfamily MFS_1 [Deinococcus marmoris]